MVTARLAGASSMSMILAQMIGEGCAALRVEEL